MNKRAETIKKIYDLEEHVEGGSFSEVYVSPDKQEGRPLAASIYFLLDGEESSHFHQLDCDEIWYYHEGCGMKITVLRDGNREEFLLGKDLENGERVMAVIPKGSIFAAENLNKEGYTLVSCVTVPAFTYEGFRLIDDEEIL